MFTLKGRCHRGAKESIIGVQIGCDRGCRSRRNAGFRGKDREIRTVGPSWRRPAHLDRTSLDLGLSFLLLLGLPFHGVTGIYGFWRLRFDCRIELFRRSAQPVIIAPVLHGGAEHLEGAAAGVDLIVMGELGKAFEDPERLLVPRARRISMLSARHCELNGSKRVSSPG